MKVTTMDRFAFVFLTSSLSGSALSNDVVEAVERPAFPSKIVPHEYNGIVLSNPTKMRFRNCGRVFLEKERGKWIVSQSQDLENERVEEIEICVESTKKGGAYDVLKAKTTSENNCSVNYYNKERYNITASRKVGYFDCNSQFRNSGLFGGGSGISKEKLSEALQSEAVIAEGKKIFKSAFLKFYTPAINGDAEDAKVMLLDFWPYLQQTEIKEFLIVFGKGTALKEFPPDLVAHADVETIVAAKDAVRKYWELTYRRQIESLLSPAADLKKVEGKIRELSVENKKRWNEEDFDHALPKLQQIAADLRHKIEQQEIKKQQEAAQQAIERQRQAEMQVAIFRKTIQIGSWTNCGQVYDVRRPMIGVQTMIGQQYIDISRLFPEGYGCYFRNGIYVGTSGS